MACWRVVAAVGVLLLPALGYADEPPGMVKVPGTPRPSAKVDHAPFTLDQTDATVLSRMEGRNTLSVLAGSRMLCLGAPNFCMVGAQAAFGFRYGDVHAGVLYAPTGGGNFNSSYLAPYGGFELGSRYYYLARWGQRTPSAFGLALRGALELMDVMPYETGGHAFSGYFGFVSTHGVNAVLLFGRHFGLYARAAVGLGVRAPTASTNESTTAGFAIDAALGLQARF